MSRTSLTEFLHLTSAPVAIAFVDAGAAGRAARLSDGAGRLRLLAPRRRW